MTESQARALLRRLVNYCGNGGDTLYAISEEARALLAVDEPETVWATAKLRIQFYRAGNGWTWWEHEGAPLRSVALPVPPDYLEAAPINGKTAEIKEPSHE